VCTTQDDLHEVMRLRQRSAEYQLGFYPGNGAAYHKHRDAFPDDGSEEVQRRVTAIAYCNEWEREHGGVLRVWPPQKATNSAVSASRRSRSPTGSEGGTSFSEVSDTSSLRWVATGPTGGAV
jgi:Rps23 Pro-64 3,4-dihydroxylase Tpa1-like proline 4-hydroxylase